MRWQTTAVLAVILFGLGAFYYVYEIRLGPEREKTEGRKGRVFSVEPGDVAEVEIKRPDSVVKLKREGDGWQILAPVKARGDRGPVDETVTSVVTARMDREIASAPQALGDFGLDRPAADVTLRLKDGKELGLALGAKSPTGVWVYAREAGKPAVFVVPDSVLRDTTRAVADFRDKTVLEFDQRDVTALDIVTRDDTLAVEQADGRWKLTRPRALPADADTVRDFLEKLRSARVKEFVAEAPPSLAPFGLDRPVRLSIHTGREKDRATKALLFGRGDPVKKGVYAMRPGESTVMLIPDETWTAVPKNVAVLRDKTVVGVERDKVTRVEIESLKGAVTLAREGERWKITAPEALPADQVEAGAVLFKLRELRAQAFLTDDASGIPRYLAKPAVRVSVTEQGAPLPRILLLAPSPERRGGAPSAYAALAGQGPVVLVDGKALEELGRSLDDLRDRTLLPGLDPKDIKRMRVRAGGQTIVVERSGEFDWKLVEGGRGAAKTATVDNLLYALRALKWKTVAAPTGDEPARYGLDAPTLEVGLLKADGSELATVLVGKRDGERAWVKLKAGPAIYTVDAKQLGESPKVPDDFRG
ncbi:MAG: hypothetical protein DMD96_05620 [Candidatus Rokuibacteriota bacterium]|nr:MAG: hypothetical protein DMD96_05620 [Candidatus Rokubacteria bacterium]